MSCVTILQRVRSDYYRKIQDDHLTPQQIIVLKLICDDLSMKMIASDLKVSIKTIEKHRQAIAKFTDTHSPIGLYKWALAHGYTQVPVRVDK